MPKDQKKYLFDILDSINLIQSYLEGIEDWEELIGNQEKVGLFKHPSKFPTPIPSSSFDHWLWPLHPQN